MAERETMFQIDTFANGVNQYTTESLMNSNEAIYAKNIDISKGAFTTVSAPTITNMKGIYDNIVRLINYDTGTTNKLYAVCYEQSSSTGKIVDVNTQISIGDVKNPNIDYLNFYKGNSNIFITVCADDYTRMFGQGLNSPMLNRRVSYDKLGNIDGYIDANGVKVTDESKITTYAPNGNCIELHYDRLWIAGDKQNPNRLYFSTSGVNGADIQDFTAPIEETEANMHGGFIDVRSYDGSKIIGLKVVMNSLIIFKDKTAYRIFGSSPDNYELVQVFGSEGAISDRSICNGDNGCYFANKEGIYFYDGTNTTLMSQKIQKIFDTYDFTQSKGLYKNNKYYLTTNISSDKSLTILYDTITKAFIFYEFDDEITDMIEFDNKVYYSTKKEIKLLDFSQNNNVAHSLWRSAYYDFGMPNTRKNTNYIYFRAIGEGDVKFILRTDKKTKEITVPLVNNKTTQKQYRKKLKNKGRIMQLEILNVDPSSKFTISNVQLSVELDED